METQSILSDSIGTIIRLVRMRNASEVKLKFTCFYLVCSVRIVFRISETVLSDGEKGWAILTFHSGIFRFLVVSILRFVTTGRPTPL